MRVIVHTGKGGVGKTSISAATALRCAELGLKTIVISTDTAHSLGDALDVEVGPEPLQIAENLWAQEIDTRYSMQKYWGRIQEYLGAFFNREGIAKVNAAEVTIIPGLEEGAQLLWISEYFQAGDYDVLIVDAAPTAETIRLLSLPDVTRWWVERLMRIARGLDSVIRPVQRFFNRGRGNDLGIDIAENAWDQVQLLFDTLDGVRELLTDPERASIRLVTNAERMVIREAQRTLTYLTLYGYGTDLVICNRVLPESVQDAYFTAWHESQKKHLGFIHEAFSPTPIRQVPLFAQEAVGLEMLEQTAAALFAEDDPSALYYQGRSHSVQREDGGYVLDVELPFGQKGKIDVIKRGDELTVRIGAYRRNIVLPTVLARLSPGAARLEESALRIPFSENAHSAV